MILADFCPFDVLFYRNHSKLFRLITSLIFIRFSIRKKFWKAENQGFPTIAFTVAMLSLWEHLRLVILADFCPLDATFLQESLQMHFFKNTVSPLVSLSENTHKCITNPGHCTKMRGDIPRNCF